MGEIENITEGEVVADFTFEHGPYGVSYLTAPYELLVKAFGNDGTVSPRDDYKSMCQWDIKTPFGEVEVYDYKVGKCHHHSGLERHKITYWHVQGSEQAIEVMLGLLAGDPMPQPELPSSPRLALESAPSGEESS